MWTFSEVIIRQIGIPLDQYEINQTYFFVLINSIVELTLSTPFKLYSTFVIEERHGFNNQVMKYFYETVFNCVVSKFHCIIFSLFVFLDPGFLYKR